MAICLNESEVDGLLDMNTAFVAVDAVIGGRMSRLSGREVVPVVDREGAVRGSDVVVAVTTSPKALFDVDWLAAGTRTHINAAGSNSLARQELSAAAVRRAGPVCVDSRETGSRAAGDLLPLIEKGRTRPQGRVEPDEVVTGMWPGRTRAEQITLAESRGMVIQDIALAAAVLERARLEGVAGIRLSY